MTLSKWCLAIFYELDSSRNDFISSGSQILVWWIGDRGGGGCLSTDFSLGVIQNTENIKIWSNKFGCVRRRPYQGVLGSLLENWSENTEGRSNADWMRETVGLIKHDTTSKGRRTFLGTAGPATLAAVHAASFDAPAAASPAPACPVATCAAVPSCSWCIFKTSVSAAAQRCKAVLSAGKRGRSNTPAGLVPR